MARESLKCLIALLALISLSNPAYGESIPHPELKGLEPAVAEQIRTLREEAEQSDQSEPADRAFRFAELGALYHSLKFKDAALACYRKAESLSPGDGRWPYLQGVLYSDQGDVASARRALLRAMALRPELATGWVRLGRLALDDGDAAGALLDFQRGMMKLPDSAAAHAGAGQAFLELGQAEQAVKHLEKALEIEPRANRLNYPLAMAYRALGDRKKMQALLKQVGPVGVTVDDPIAEYATSHTAGARIQMRQGNKAYKAGDYATAVRHFTRATEASPDQGSAWTNLGAAQGAMGDMKAARRNFEKALEINPDSTAALENLVAVLVSEDDEKATLSLLNERLGDDTKNSDLLFRRAELRRVHGNPEDAAADFTHLVELMPHAKPAWMGLILSRIQAGEHDKARAILNDAGQALQDLPSFESELVDGLVVIHDGDPDDAALARSIAKSLYDDKPNMDNAVRVARTLMLGNDDCSDAEEWLEEQIKSRADNKSLQGKLKKVREKLDELERCGA